MSRERIQHIAVILFRLFIIIGIVIYIAGLGYANLFSYTKHLNADIAGESLVARSMWIHQSIDPKGWYYAMEGRFFHLAPLVAIFYGVTGSLQTSMALGCIAALLAIICGVVYLLRAIGMKRNGIYIGVLAVLALPINIKYLELVYLYAAYYFICTVVMLFALGFYIKLVRKTVRFVKLGFVIHVICAFLLGCISMRGMLNIYCPLMIVEGLRHMVEKRGRIWNIVKQREGLMPLFFNFLMLIVGFAGTLTPFGVGLDVSKSIRRSPQKFVYEVIPTIFDILGFHSLDSDDWFLRLLLTVFLIIAVGAAIYIIMHLDVNNGIHIMIAFLWASPLLAILMETVTTMEASNRYAYVLVMTVAISLAVVFERLLDNHKFLPAYILVGVILLFSGMNFKCTYIPLMNTEKAASELERESIINWMTENEYYYGYAGFENANTFTVQSDGAVQVSPIFFDEMKPFKWLSDAAWYPPYVGSEEDIVFILRKSQREEFDNIIEERYPEVEEAFETEEFVVYTSSENYIKEPDP